MKVKHITYALLVVSLFCAAAPAADLAPRPLAQKPARTIIVQHQYLDRITVKFHDGLHVRARNNVLTDEGTGALNNPNAVAALTGPELSHTTGLHVPVDSGVAPACLR